MGSNYTSPPAKRSITGLPDPNPFHPNGSSKRAKFSKASLPLSIPPGHVSFRLLCNASRIGGVIGKSGVIIKNLQQSTGAKIRIEDAPSESPDRIITVIGSGDLAGKVLLRSRSNNYNGDGEVFEVSSAQEALLKVFDRILEVAAETTGIELGDTVVSCRLVTDAAQAGSVIGKGGNIVEKIRKDTGCKIRLFTDNLPACTSSSDEVIEIEGNVSSLKKALVAVSRRLQDCSSTDRAKMMASKPYEGAHHEDLVALPRETLTSVPRETFIGALRETSSAVPRETFFGAPRETFIGAPRETFIGASRETFIGGPRETSTAVPRETFITAPRETFITAPRETFITAPRETFMAAPHENLTAAPRESITDLHVDHLLQRRSALSSLPSSSNSYATGVHSLSAEANRVSSLEPKALQQEITFRILCSNDRVGGIIGKGGNIVKSLQSETGATISVGPSVGECEDRLITITASENPESRYSPAQKAVVLVFSRSVETGIEKGIGSGLNMGSSVTARLVVPSNQVGCLLGKGGVVVSEMRKATSANIKIIGTDQVPKCASENDQVVQISGEFSNVQDALYNATGRLRDNLFVGTHNNVGTRSLSSARPETSPYGRPRDVVPLGSQPDLGISHSLSRHTFSQGVDHLAFSRNLDRPSSPGLWTPPTVAGINSRSINEFSWGPTPRRGGLELVSGSKSAIVTNTTVEIVVPEDTLDLVYGENGSNLARLRQISGAKVVIHERRSGTSDRTIILSGSPDETQAAQSLLQAFILNGS